MQRILSMTKIALNVIPKPISNIAASFSMFQNAPLQKLLPTRTPLQNLVCTLKIKGHVKRRCKSCYFVMRDARLYVMCKEHPRHKQAIRAPKPLNTWILTHASQSKQRPW